MTISSAYPAVCVAHPELPQFNQYGLLPPGIYDSDVAQVKERFCYNDHREAVFSRFETYVQHISVFGVKFACFLDGSFISDKEHPQDIDLVLDIPDSKDHVFHIMRQRQTWSDERWLLLNLDRVRREFGLHFFHWSPMMQVGGPNDQVENFQNVYAQTAVDIQSRKGTKPPLTHRKGIVRVFV